MKCTLLALLTLVLLQTNAQNVGDYQSAASGDWTNAPAARWDVWDGDSWEDAVAAPTSASGVITILSGHNITVGLAAVTADQVVVAAGGILTINSTLTIDDGLGIDLDVDGTLTLNGSLSPGTGTPSAEVDGVFDWLGGTLTLATTVSPGGILNINTANKTLAGVLTNNGTINWLASQVTFNNGTLNNNASFNATASSSFNNTAATTNIFNNNSGGTFTKSVNAGNITFNIPVNNAGTININTGAIISTSVNASFTNSGAINFNSTSLTIAGTLAGGNALNAGTSFSGTGTITITGSTAINFALDMPSTVLLVFNTGTLSGTGSLEINGAMTWSTGTISVATIVDPAATLTLSGVAVRALNTATLTNNGNIAWTGASINFSNATLTNNGTITASADNAFANTAGTNSFVNNGTFTKSAGAGNTTFNVPVTNPGTINVNSGTVVKTTTAMTNTGTIALSSTTFSHAGGIMTLAAGTNITGTGNYTTTAATIINANLIVGPTITYTMNVGATIDLTSTGSVTVNGVFNWNHALGLNVPFTIAAGATANAGGGNAKIAAGPFTNNGTLNLGNITAFSIGSANFPSQTFTNNGTINEAFTAATVLVGSGGGVGVKTFVNSSTGIINKTSANTFSFTTVTVNNAGILRGIGTYLFTTISPNTGSIQPGSSPGILSSSANALGANSPTVVIEVVNGSGAGTGHDRLDLTGTTTLTNTTLTVTDDPGAPGQTYTIMTAPGPNGFTGTFAATNLPAGYSFSIDNSTNPSTVTVTKTAVVGPPVFSNVPPDVTVQCDNIPAPGSPTASNTCEGGVTVVYNGETRTDGSCADSYTLTRSWTATDNCGNSVIATQTITVIDDTKPVFTFVPANTTVQCSAIPAIGAPTATDNCDTEVSIVYNGQTVTPGSCADAYTITRTWTATDNCGNTETGTQTITVIDDTKPVFTFVPANTTAQCNALPAVGTPVAADNCDNEVSIVYNGETSTPGDCENSYTLTRTWTATDNCGNTETATQIITVVDDTDPVFSFVPANITVQCDAIPTVGSATATDNCDNDVTVTYDGQTITPGSCADSYTITRTWTATDNCGNSATATQTITIVDDTDPVFSFVPANTSAECSAIPAVGSPTATDNCDNDVAIVYNGQTTTPGATADSYTITRTWTATDNCGNSAIGTQTITVTDDTDPVFTFVPANTSVECSAIPAAGTPTATDNCDEDVTITYNGEMITPGACADSYTITRSWTATDNAGNTASATQTIMVADETDPVFSFVPANATVQCDAVPAVGTPTASDNCDNEVSIVYNGQTITPGTCADSYTITRSWTATDNCGNSTNATQTITVIDDTDPVFTFVPAGTTIQCGTVLPEAGTPTATDNCDNEVSIVYDGETITPGACADSYTVTRTWTATDNCGNSTVATQVINVVDDTDPVFTFVPANATIQCGTSEPAVGTPTASDNCDSDVTIVYNGQTITPGSCADSYTITRTWTATDNCGNSTTASQVINVVDDTGPEFTFVPASTTAECSAIPAVGTPTATDNCDNDVSIVYNGETTTPGATMDSYTITRSWTATDNCGNNTTATQTITVTDDTDPVFTFVPANTSAECNAIPGVGAPAASDNCDNDVTITYNGQTVTPGVCPDSYTITRSWTATDNAGNSATAMQVITVTDEIDPVFSFVPANGTVQCDAIPVVGIPTATDNCDNDVSIVYNGQTIIPGDCADTYTIIRSWTATDNCGNNTTATQTITVVDDTDPVFSFVPAGTSIQCGTSLPDPGTPTATDNCDNDVTIVYNGETITPGSCADSYTVTRSWTATDNCGNSTVATQVINVVDDTDPVFTFVPANTSAACDNIPDGGTPTASDNCDADVTVTYNGQTITPGANADSYTITRSWTATDNCGNSATALQTITVTDDTDPVFTFVPTNTTTQCSAIPAVGNPTASDNCDNSVSIVYNGQTITPGSCADAYTITRSWTATDNAGNNVNASQTITVIDDTDPVFTFVPANTTAQCNAVPAAGIPTATDNCDANVTITYNGQTTTPGACQGSYTITRSWTATDNCGNTAEATQTINVVDNTAPAFSCLSNAVRQTNSGNCTYTAVGNEFNATATDNCSDAVLMYTLSGATTGTGSSLAGVVFNRGVTTVAWSATDACENSSTCSFTVTVNDVTAPTIECPANIEQTAGGGAVSITTPDPIIDDNCAVTTLTWVLTGATTGSSPAVGLNYVGTRNFNPGVTTVTYTARDAANNATSCSFTVTIIGLCQPTIECPPDITVNAFPLLCYGLVFDLGDPVTSGGCGGGSLTVTNDRSTLFFPVGVTEITWTVKDKNGNTATCVQKITVVDAQDPLLVCPSDKTVSTNAGQCYATEVDLGSPLLAWDNCGIATITNNAPSQFPLGTTVVTWTVTDIHGNSSTCTQDVTVGDGTGPVMTCPANITQSTVGNACTRSITTQNPTAFDNCTSVTRLTWTLTGATTASSPSTGINYVGTRTFNAGLTTVTYTARDVAGNSSSCSFTVLLTESQLPNITCPANVTQNAQGNNCSRSIKVPNPSVSDNCAVVSLSWVMTGATTGSSVLSGINYIGTRTFNVGTTTVTYTVKDGSGNARSCSFTVRVTENQKPKINCPSNINQSIGNNCSKTIATPNPSFSDNCGVVSLTWVMTGATTGSSASSGINYVGTKTFNIGTTTITYTATDASGNTRSCSFTVRLTGNCNTRVNDAYTSVEPKQQVKGLNAKLEAIAFPNPSDAGFNLQVTAVKSHDKLQVKVYDIVGRIVHQATGVPGQTFRFGESFIAGTYLVEVMQGTERISLKLIKQ